MPRQSRKYPRKLGRFNYWNMAGITPQDSDELKTFSPSWMRDYSHALAHKQFYAHLRSQSCGVTGCTLDAKIRATNGREQRAFLALKRYVEGDRLWSQDRAAHRVLDKLPETMREGILTLDRRALCTRWRSMEPLLQKIARDQKIMEDILREHLAGDPAGVSDPRGLSEAQLLNIYRAYIAQVQVLLGNITSHRVRGVMRGRGSDLKPLSRPVVPQRTLIDDDEAWPMFGCDGKLIDYEQVGDPIDPATRIEMAVHWFAHALRNLLRYSQGNPPLPFQNSCAKRCLAERNRLAQETFREK